MNGVLIVDKPAGRTSHDVVALARRALGIRRIGHTGTLDPFATGVLPLVVGSATRLARFLTASDKEYVAAVRFGRSSPTYDAGGLADASGPAPDPGVGRDALERALDGFRGTYQQTPPAFSAKKVGGVRAYRMARANTPVELQPVTITVSSLVLESLDGSLATVRLTCSSGFYVRSFAHDLGQRLGCGALLEALRRTRAGDFSLAAAIDADALVAAGRAAAARLVPIDDLLPRWPTVVLTADGARRAAHGAALTPRDFSPAAPVGEAPHVRLLDEAGHLIGIAEGRAGGVLHPAVVLV